MSAANIRSPCATSAPPFAKAEEHGFLGEHILGTPFSFKLQVREGAGAFVCGEETALIQSIEGKRGMPRPRPPYPAQSGLWGKPTLINNVETLACLPWIIRRGPEAFAALGTEKSKGTKVFSLVGKINRGGLIEVPMGITIREIVEEIGGGIKGRQEIQGGAGRRPLGRVHSRAPGRHAHRLRGTGLDRLHHGLRRPGGAGRPRLRGRDRPLLPALHPERVLRQVHLLPRRHQAHAGDPGAHLRGQRARKGTCRPWKISAIHVKKGSLCGLGQTAPNPVLTTLRYFREEYEAHIRERRCPAAQCKALIHYRC